mgnify:CR=1 FL=1
MKIFWLFIAIVMCSVEFGLAQTTISVDIDKATLSWAWTQGIGGAVSEFRMKCGQTTGVYTKVTALADPAARSTPVKTAIAGPGNWFCAVTAANQFGESGLSNEIAFAAGNVPMAPTGLQIIAQ